MSDTQLFGASLTPFCADIRVQSTTGISYEYIPLRDITAWELAKITQWLTVVANNGHARDFRFDEYILSNPELARHWVKLD